MTVPFTWEERGCLLRREQGRGLTLESDKAFHASHPCRANPPPCYSSADATAPGRPPFARRLLAAEGIDRFLNADELARGLSPLKPELMAVRAGRSLLEEARRLIEARCSFGLESTLSGKTYARLMKEAKTAGFFIALHFLVVPSPEVSIERVAQRVRKGGHHVPDADIHRRFRRSVENFLQVYVPLADAWTVWDNEGDTARRLASSEENSYDELVQLLTQMSLKEDEPSGTGSRPHFKPWQRQNGGKNAPTP